MFTLTRREVAAFLLACAAWAVTGPPVTLAAAENPLSPETIVEKKFKGKATVEFSVGEVYLRPTSWATSSERASAFDLTTIDRRISKEPPYQGKPKYCLVVFGPKAEKRVWLVLDGDVLYVDRNGNGDLTEYGKRVERYKSPDPEPPGAAKLLSFSVKNLTDTNGKAEHLYVHFDGPRAGLFWGSVGFQTVCGGYFGQPGVLQFANRAQDAPVVHFGGPLRLGFVKPPTFRSGPPSPDEPDRVLEVNIGTQGLGKGTFAYLLYAKRVPWNSQVTAEIEFPSRVPGGPPIKTKQVLTRL
jgi:hypothetical protein